MPLTFYKKPAWWRTSPAAIPISDLAEVVLAAIGAGADVIELGVPFSDPVADGPVIQRASETRAAARNLAGAGVDAGGEVRCRRSRPG